MSRLGIGDSVVRETVPLPAARSDRAILSYTLALDRRGQGIAATLGAAAALLAAGLPVDLAALAAAMPEATRRGAPQRPLTLPADPPALDLRALAAANGFTRKT